MKASTKHGMVISLIWFLAVLPACTSTYKSSGFFDDYSVLQEGEYLKQEYIAPGADLYGYQKVIVRSVEMKYFENAEGKFSQEDINKLSTRLHESLKEELGEKYVVLGETAPTDKNTLIVSPALVYVKTPNRLLNVATFWLIGFNFSKGAAAFEAKLIDGGSNKVVAEVAEKRKSAGGITDVKGILLGGWMRFASADGIFKRWGKDLVKLTTPPKKKQ
ncbi:MAG TPA: DUF3313 domain-containing protein [bacterium]|nr:DUF3313 domain-containing protein [bacterium]